MNNSRRKAWFRSRVQSSVDPAWVALMISTYRALHPEQSDWFDGDGAPILAKFEDVLYGIGEDEPFLWKNFKDRDVANFILIHQVNGTNLVSLGISGESNWFKCSNGDWTLATHGGGNNISGPVDPENRALFVTSFSNFVNVTGYGTNSRTIAGQLPKYNFPNATFIRHNSNQISGILPTISAPNLVEFTIALNSLTLIKEQNLPLCQTFNIRGNQHRGVAPPNLTLPKVVAFIAYGVFLTGSGTFQCPVYDFPDCENFQMYNNTMFTGQPMPLFKLPKVRFFEMYACNMTGNIPDLDCPLMETFIMDRNNFASTGLSLSHWNETNFPEMRLFNIRTTNNSFQIPALFFPKCSNYQIYQNNMASGRIDDFINNHYDRRLDKNITGSVVTVRADGPSGPMPNPTGVYQNASPPTTPYEKMYKLCENPDGESRPTWSIRINDGTFP